MKLTAAVLIVMCFVLVNVATSAEWTQFRGPGGSGAGDASGLPIKWSTTENIVWKTDLPGPGTSSPVVVGGRVYVTCYSGYGIVPNEGSKDDLMRHVVCVDRKSGRILWTKDFKAQQPESTYSGGNNSQHGYSSSTPASDGERLYVFFGKSGVYCLDLDGNERWHVSVGEGVTGWGSSNSPLLYKNLIIINASVESGSLVALNKQTGEEVWRTKGMRSSWNTPILVSVPKGKTEVVVVNSGHILGFDPADGKELWRSEAFGGYICASAVAHKGIVYALQSSAIAVRAGGRGEVSKTHELWRAKGGSKVPSPVYYDGHLYWIPGGTAYCLNTLWIRERLKNDNIKFVIHLGDIVQTSTKKPEWENANQAMRLLDGVVPYSMVPGNHDMVVKSRDSTLYNEYFSPARFADRKWYGGHMGETNDNNYCFFEACGMKFMVISLEFAPRNETLEWAAGVARCHPDRRVIVATHCYMRPKGRDTSCATSYKVTGNSGEQMWQKLVRRQPNIFLVVSGHVLGVGLQTSVNDAGGKVLEMLTDYQCLPNGGDGWLRTLQFVPSENKINVKTYSPLLNKHNKDAKETFSLDYEMSAAKRKAG